MKREDLFMSDEQIRKSTFDLEPAFNDGRIEPIEMDRAISQTSALYAVEKVLEYIEKEYEEDVADGRTCRIMIRYEGWQQLRDIIKENEGGE